MKYVEFDETRPMDLVLLGRVAIVLIQLITIR